MDLTEFKALVNQAVVKREGRTPADPQPLRFVNYELEYAHLRELVGRCQDGTDRVKSFANLMHEAAVRHMAFGDVLYDKQKIEQNNRYGLDLDRRLASTKPGTPRHSSLLAEKKSLENYHAVTRCPSEHC